MNQQTNPGVTIVQLTQPTIPGTEFNQDSFKVEEASVLSPAPVENFYAGVHGEQVVGLIGITETNKGLTAAVVGNWVAAGYKVEMLSLKEMLKKMRPAPVAAPKPETEAPAATPAPAAAQQQPEAAPAAQQAPAQQQTPVAQTTTEQALAQDTGVSQPQFTSGPAESEYNGNNGQPAGTQGTDMPGFDD